MSMTLEQKRANDALACINNVQAVAKQPFKSELGSRYRSYVERLPAYIVMNGLGQAVATLMARKNGSGADAEAYGLLLDHLQNWLCRKEQAAPYAGAGSRGDTSLIRAIATSDQDVYVRAHAEALAYLVWLKKFAQAFLPRSKESSHD